MSLILFIGYNIFIIGIFIGIFFNSFQIYRLKKQILPLEIDLFARECSSDFIKKINERIIEEARRDIQSKKLDKNDSKIH